MGPKLKCIFLVEDEGTTTPRRPQGRIGPLVEWILEDPTRPATLEILAGRAAMSTRTLLRRFRRETGLSPAKFIERARIEYAKRLLEQEGARAGRVATLAGFGNDERMRRSFHRVLGMSPRAWRRAVPAVALATVVLAAPAVQAGSDGTHGPLNAWVLPATPPAPRDNLLTAERAELGKKLFFDPRLSMSGQVTCASCHLPERGWADGLPTAVRFQGAVLPVATPSLLNVAYNEIYMWDGRQPTLEQQAVGGQAAAADINAGGTGRPEDVPRRLGEVPGYRAEFAKAYPGEGISAATIGKALASFERTLVSRGSPFDRWVAGEANAMTPQQVKGFRLFNDPLKGACSACHQPPNFTDNGFHNIGLKSFGVADPHPGRYKHRPVKAMMGAFKTPSLRDVARTAPYFHDGSARTLAEVVEHYARGGEVTTNLSPSFRKADLTDAEKADLVAFLDALSSPAIPFTYPVLPR